MSYAVRRLLNHLPIQIGTRSDRRLRTATLKHAQFASFLENDGFRNHSTDHYDRSLRRRRLVKIAFLCAFGVFAAWIAIESARALTVF